MYSNEDIVCEYDYDGSSITLAVEYVHDMGIDDVVAMVRSGNTYYYHKDGLGSVNEITDSTGSVVKTYEYKTFGTITRETGTIENPYTYTGREYDAETGLYYYRARYYMPEVGRFTTKDPIALDGGLNQYVYVGNNPLNAVDPWGEIEWNVREDYYGLSAGVEWYFGGSKYKINVSFYLDCSGYGDEVRLIKYDVTGWSFSTGWGAGLFKSSTNKIQLDEYPTNFAGDHIIWSFGSIETPMGSFYLFDWDSNESTKSNGSFGTSLLDFESGTGAVGLATIAERRRETWRKVYDDLGKCPSKGGYPKEK